MDERHFERLKLMARNEKHWARVYRDLSPKYQDGRPWWKHRAPPRAGVPVFKADVWESVDPHDTTQAEPYYDYPRTSFLDEDDPTLDDPEVVEGSNNFRSHLRSGRMYEAGLDYTKELNWLKKVPAKMMYMLRRGLMIIRGWKGKRIRQEKWIQKTTNKLNRWVLKTKGENHLGLGDALMKYALNTARQVFPLYDAENP
jgi:hypothetical protein